MADLDSFSSPLPRKHQPEQVVLLHSWPDTVAEEADPPGQRLSVGIKTMPIARAA